jgi:hypothetical protein
MIASLVNRVTKKSIYLLVLTALLAGLLMDTIISVSIGVGGIIGIINFRVLARATEKLLSGFMPNITIVLFSVTKIFLTGIVLFLLLQINFVSIPSFLVGFTCVVLLILFEGIMIVKRAPDRE